MAGRLRTQLKVLTEIWDAAHELADQILYAGPEDALRFETTIKRLRGEALDEKFELWNEMHEAASNCEHAAERLVELLEARIRKLPTYKPPLTPTTPTDQSVTLPPGESAGS
jgi:hypothetical protein